MNWQQLADRVRNTEIINFKSVITQIIGDLDASIIESIAGQAKRLTVQLKSTIDAEVGFGWKSLGTSVIDGVAKHIAEQDGAILEWVNDNAWQNPFVHDDVDGNGRVTAIDALVVLNWLGREGNTVLDQGDIDPETTRYVDVDGSGDVTPLDALRVLNRVTRARALQAESEVFGVPQNFSAPSISAPSFDTGDHADSIDQVFAQGETLLSGATSSEDSSSDVDWIGAYQTNQLASSSTPESDADDEEDEAESPDGTWAGLASL